MATKTRRKLRLPLFVKLLLAVFLVPFLWSLGGDLADILASLIAREFF